MRRFAILVIAVVFSGVGANAAVHGHQASPTSSDVPARAAPLGLGSVDLPTDEEAIAALFTRLPASVAGEPRVALPTSAEPGRIEVAYGEGDAPLGPPLTLWTLNLATGDFFPADFTADQFVRTVAGVPDYGTEAFGRDGTLSWVRATSTVGVEGLTGTPSMSRPLHTLAWGDADSPWLFGAAAATSAGLDALVIAFVTAAGGQPTGATPGASPAPAATPAASRGTRAGAAP